MDTTKISSIENCEKSNKIKYPNIIISMITTELIRSTKEMTSAENIGVYVFDDIIKTIQSFDKVVVQRQINFQDKGLDVWSGAVIFSALLPNFSFCEENLIIINGMLIQGIIGLEQLTFYRHVKAPSFIQIFYEKYGEEITIDFIKKLSLVSSRYISLKQQFF